MGRGRLARLIRHAAVEGLIDLERARTDDPWWWQMLVSAVEVLQARRLFQVHRLSHAQQLAAVAAGGENASQHWEYAGKSLKAAVRLWFPEQAGELKDDAARLKGMWERHFGPMEGQDYERKVRATVAWLQRHTARR